MKNVNMILTEKQQKCQHYQRVKLICINILKVEEYSIIFGIFGPLNNFWDFLSIYKQLV